MTNGDQITMADLPPFINFSNPLQSRNKKTLKQVYNEHIKFIMTLVEANKTQAANILYIHKEIHKEINKPWKMQNEFKLSSTDN